MPRINAPAPNITGPVLRFSMYSKSQGQVCINSWDFMAEGGVTNLFTDMAQFLTTRGAEMTIAAKLVFTASTTVTAYTIACISVNTAVSQTSLVSFVGTVSGNPLPLEMAAILQRSSTLKGQHGRGRIYAPSVPASFTTPATNPNIINTTGVTAYNGFMNVFGGSITPDGVQYNSVVATRPIKPAAVVSRAQQASIYTVIPLLGTQRRRREGRGI